MRVLTLAAIVVALGLTASSSQAASSITAIWRSTGTPTLVASPIESQTETAILFASADSAGLSAFAFSLVWDEGGIEDPGVVGIPLPLGEDELSFVRGLEAKDVPIGMGASFSPADRGLNLIRESNGYVPGTASSFDLVSINGALVSKSRSIGTVVFTTNPGQISNDGADLRFAISNNAIDGAVDAAGGVANVVFGTLQVDLLAIPEPTTAALLGLGLAGVAFSGRRRRS